MEIDPASSVEAIRAIDVVPAILDTVCRVTGMGFAAIARVTEARWVACSVKDDIAFGLEPGGELKLETTICHEIRDSRQAVVIPDVARDAVYRNHHTPAHYGFRSYISFPIVLRDGRFFGTLCAIDPEPRDLDRPEVGNIFRMFADLIGFHLGMGQELSETQADLGRERQTGIQREQFIAVLGHDLRNPLAALEAGLSLMKRAPDQKRAEFIMSAMQTTIDRMNAMVGNILDFARGRLVGDLPLRFKAESAEAIVTQIVNELAIAHPDREIVLHCDSATPLMCDAQRIGQLVSNLVGNALTHGEQGTPVVVACRESDDEFTLSVTNNGPEIPMQVRETLFQPFEQGAESHASGSLGLGLYIASTIAKAHGGSLTVQSSPTETRFAFRMSLAAT
ncbi:GAF domain-containing sensor histidine kinase [Sphingopyxis macrogoltabida]|uniref:histidine kinase n=1 Tax=Sphingopyxis macrogoltabida TaxID=33050 RepID=A0A0N9UKH1_SPHMC|nr:GAF domain-containing sensor histidine kinase [Sphingopyxis macrogoltabida]ALH79847.1 histidine kinase [Sphingopyxis macrogoltabida]